MNTMPSVLRGHIPLILQFLRFGVVGGMGFVVDNSVVYATHNLIGPYWAGALSYPIAATFTWAVNRAWTFRGQGSGPAHHQWAKFVATNLLGFVLNRGTYFTLIALSPLFAHNLWLALAAGTGAGMFVNFYLARSVVFK